jgi:hypothetical protein
MRTVCVTALCGSRDDLIQNVPNGDGAKFVCFTDRSGLRSDTWAILPAYDKYRDTPHATTRNAKHHKVMIHEYFDCEYSLWMDSTAVLMRPVSEIVDRYIKDFDVVFFPHWEGRTCAYQEAGVIIERGIDTPEMVNAQMGKYASEGYPRGNGLFAGTIILRRHTKRTEEFNSFWWNEICNHSRRDQLSLNYSLWKTGAKAGAFCGMRSPENNFIRLTQHVYH